MENLRALLNMVHQAGATRVLQVPAFGVVATGQSSTPQNIVCTRGGYFVALHGSIASGAIADYAATNLRLQIGGTEDFFVDGQGGPAFSPFLLNFGVFPGYKRVLRRVEKGDLWTFTVQNLTAGNVTPTVSMDFIGDDDLQTVLASMKG